MLLRQVEVSVGDPRREHEAVVIHAAGFPELLELFRTEHFAQGIGRIDRAVDYDMREVNALGTELGIQGLTQHAPPAHCRRV